MTKFLYLRLACRNIRNGRQTFLPFLVASCLLAFSLYSFSMIALNPGVQAMRGADAFMMILGLGLIVVGLFTAVFLFYANSFLIRRRKKELGLYSILGMERRHVVRVLGHELMLCYLITMAVGLGLGMLLARLMFLIIRTLCRMEITLTSSFSGSAAAVTAGLFAGLFVLLFLYNAWQVRFSKPVDLLHGQQMGEKEPKARWILAVLGVVCMGAGYYIAQIVSNPMAAIALFFVAVLLVIAGTYLVFLTGSIALLKLLKNRKSFYYTSKHFVTISGMLYRMKQNAAGLASIVILCTMAMITIGTTVAMYFGSESMLNSMYPADLRVTVDTKAQADTVARIAREMPGSDLIEETDSYRGRTLWMYLHDGELSGLDAMDENDLNYFERLFILQTLTLDDFNALEGSSMTLAAEELAWWGKKFPGDVTADGTLWRMTEVKDMPVYPGENPGTAYNTAVLIVPDEATAERLAAVARTAQEYNSGYEAQAKFTVQWSLGGTEEERIAYGEALKTNLRGGVDGFSLADKTAARQDWYTMYGGFLFVGVFLGLVFLMGTALIIYFKQVSEGYQDHDRYIILQKVGMSQEEVKHTVGRQISIVFFLPLAVAVLHVLGALHMIVLMLMLFGLLDVPYIAMNTLGAAVLVGGVYFLFYHRTAKAYFRLVRF